MKIAFKIYGWLGIESKKKAFKESGISNWTFYLLPNIEMDCWTYKDKGGWFCLQFMWLIFGITFDWRRDD